MKVRGAVGVGDLEYREGGPLHTLAGCEVLWVRSER